MIGLLWVRFFFSLAANNLLKITDLMHAVGLVSASVIVRGINNR